MPAYEYQCRGCGEHFERRQKMSEPEIAACPACGGEGKRLISGGAGAITKGAAAHAAPACGMGGAGRRKWGRAGCGCAN